MRGVLIALVLVGGVARADQNGARGHFLAGLQLYSQGQWEAALAEYRAAWATWEDPELLLDMAECNRHLGNYDRARELYQGFLEREPQSPLRGSVERQLARLDEPQSEAPPPAELVAAAAARPTTATAAPDLHAGRTAKAIGIAGWLTGVATFAASIATWQLSSSAQNAAHADLDQLRGSNGFTGSAAEQAFYANPGCSPPSSLSNTGRYVSDCNRGQQLSTASTALIITSLIVGAGGTASYIAGVYQADRAGVVEVRPAISLSEATLTLRFPF